MPDSAVADSEVAVSRKAPGTIRDPIHGNIRLSKELRTFLDHTPIFQRLRYIRQLGPAYLVYPGACHTRFDHSLGTWHIMRKMVREINLNNVEKGLDRVFGREEVHQLEVAALLHDLGHLPFSHTFESVPELSRVPHELITRHLLLAKDHPIIESYHNLWGEVNVAKNVSQTWKIGKEQIESVVVPIILDGRQNDMPVVALGSEMMYGLLGASKLDYLNRDAYYCGLDYRFLDYDRIFSSLTVERRDGEEKLALVLDQKGQRALESIVFGYYVLYTQVYWHHAIRAIRAMLSRALRKIIKPHSHLLNEIAPLTDEKLLWWLVDKERSRSFPPECMSLALRLLERRNLYKRGAVRSFEDMSPPIRNYLLDLRRALDEASLRTTTESLEKVCEETSTLETRIATDLIDKCEYYKEEIEKFESVKEETSLDVKALVRLQKLKNGLEWLAENDIKAPSDLTEQERIIVDWPVPLGSSLKEAFNGVLVSDVESFSHGKLRAFHRSYDLTSILKDLRGHRIVKRRDDLQTLVDKIDTSVKRELEPEFGASFIADSLRRAIDSVWKFRVLCCNRQLAGMIQVLFDDLEPPRLPSQ